MKRQRPLRCWERKPIASDNFNWREVAHKDYGSVVVHVDVLPDAKASAKTSGGPKVKTLGTPGNVTTSTKKYENESPAKKVSQWNERACEPPSSYSLMSTS